MFKKEGYHQLSIKWKAQKRRDINDKVSKITYEQFKNDDQSLKDFIVQEKSKGATIYLDYFIDDTDLGFWLNLHFYKFRVVGSRLINPIGAICNIQDFKKFNFHYAKILLKRLLGQFVSREECLEFANHICQTREPDEIQAFADTVFKEDNQDTMLYGSDVYASREGGYFGMKVYHIEDSIQWHMNLYGHMTKFKFEKEAYFKALEEYILFFNEELLARGVDPVNVFDLGEPYLSKPEKVNRLTEKYDFTREAFNRDVLMMLFKTATLEEIDTSLFLANETGMNLEQIRLDLENTYEGFSKGEKDSISWKIIDLGDYVYSLELYDRASAFKAYLLYNEEGD